MRPDPPDLPLEPEEADLAAGRIEEALLRHASLQGERRPSLVVRDCPLEDCDLANLAARGATLVRVAVAGGRLTGCDLSGGTLRDVRIERCRADLVALTGAELERVVLDGCDLGQADLQGARLRSVVLEDCDLRGADLTGARFDGVGLRGCRLDGIRGAERLNGIRMPWPDVLAHAGLFAAACGVQVLTEED